MKMVSWMTFSRYFYSNKRTWVSHLLSESIWTEAAADIIGRGGRTRSGSRIYNDLDTPGDKARAIMKHLVEAQMPFSASQINRIFKAGLKDVRYY